MIKDYLLEGGDVFVVRESSTVIRISFWLFILSKWAGACYPICFSWRKYDLCHAHWRREIYLLSNSCTCSTRYHDCHIPVNFTYEGSSRCPRTGRNSCNFY